MSRTGEVSHCSHAYCLAWLLILTPLGWATLPQIGAAQTSRLRAQGQESFRQEETYRQYVRGLLVRIRFVAPPGQRQHTELWDLLVGPGVRSDAATLPGGAVLEVRAGSGTIRVDGREQELKQGTTLDVPEGARFSLQNSRKDLGLAIRATVISRRQP